MIQKSAQFFVAFVLGAIAMFAVMRHNNTVIYDPTVLAHVHEAIMNAEQIRRGNSDEVLSRTDEWLRSERIGKSVEVYMTGSDLKAEAKQAIERYRSKYPPLEESDGKDGPVTDHPAG